MAINSPELPPYPHEGATTRRLYGNMVELYDWTTAQREELGTDAVPKFRPLTEAAYMQQPVRDQFRHFVVMRRIREMWDHLIRAHGTHFDADHVLRQRVALLQVAAELLDTACIAYERREASYHEDMERMRNIFAAVAGYIGWATKPFEEEFDALRK